MTTILQIAGLDTTVAGEAILDGLSLAVEAGEVHAIVGLNDTGTSTLSGTGRRR